MVEKGKRPDVVSYNSLIMGLCNNGKVDEAMKLFHYLLRDGNNVEPDVVTFNAVIHGLCKEGRLDEAMEIYDAMVERRSFGNLYTYNILIGECIKGGIIEKAMELWKCLHELGFIPSSTTYTVIIDGFCKVEMLSFAKGLFIKMRLSGLSPMLSDYNASMASLCKECSLEQSDVYDSLLKAFVSQGKPEEVINLLHQMADADIILDLEITNTILTFLFDSAEYLNAVELLPNFSSDLPEKTNISCSKLLMKVQKSSPELQLGAA